MRRLAAAAQCAAFVLTLLAPAVGWAAVPPPLNDDFATASIVPGLPFDAAVDTTAATLEPGEPNLCVGDRSVWYAFTATTQVLLTVDAANSSFADVKLAAYRTSALTPVFCGSGHQATFSVPGGQTVYIQAIDQGSGGGALVLTFAVYNNDFAAARSIDALPFSSSVSAYPATFQAASGERDPCGYALTKTVWYAYAPIETTEVVVDTAGSDDGSPRLTAYFSKTGPGLVGLSNGVCGTATEIDFVAVAGSVYYIQAFGSGVVGTALQVNIREVPPDILPPTFTGTPADISVTTTHPAGALVTYAPPSAIDDISGDVPVVCQPAPGSMFPVGTSTVTCTATDAAGNGATTSFNVNVTLDVSGDTTPPTFTYTPSQITVTAYGPNGAAVAYPMPTAVDDFSGPVPVACVPPPGSVFPTGTTHVSCTAADDAGSVASTGFDVTVIRLYPPSIPPIIPIASYDVDDGAMSGSGCFYHDYAGAILDSGRTFYPGGACTPVAGHLAAYRGGGGTLNDGLDTLTYDGTQLIYVGQPVDQGGVVDPVITLHLDGAYRVSQIRIYGGQTAWNALPGQLVRATVVIGGQSVTLDTIPFGPPNAIDVPTGDLLDLTGTDLAGVATSTIVLRGFASGFIDQFPIAEITVDGTAAPPDAVPPVVTVSGAAPSYAVDARVAIAATAVDDRDGPLTPTCTLVKDGVADPVSTSCAIDADAWSLGLGRFTYTSAAADAAGNAATATATFDVVATYPSVRSLTSAWTKKASVAKDLVNILDSAYAAEQRGQYTAEANKLKDYRAAVRAQSGKAIDADKATLLITFSSGL